MTKHVVLGLDLGPVTEPSALVVIEGERVNGVFTSIVRYVHQFPQGLPYADIARLTGQVIREGSLGAVPVLVDRTAVGPSVLPVLRPLLSPAWVIPIVLTAGGTATKDESGTWRIPKRDLITHTQILLQGQRLRIPTALPHANLLLRELHTFRTSMPVNANPDMLDWRDRPHDDLVLATALACWWSDRHPPYVAGSIQSGGNDELLALFARVFPDLEQGVSP